MPRGRLIAAIGQRLAVDAQLAVTGDADPTGRHLKQHLDGILRRGRERLGAGSVRHMQQQRQAHIVRQRKADIADNAAKPAVLYQKIQAGEELS